MRTGYLCFGRAREKGGSLAVLDRFASGSPGELGERVGLKGFEPLTLRLSSACSNQLSYRPDFDVEGVAEGNCEG